MTMSVAGKFSGLLRDNVFIVIILGLDLFFLTLFLDRYPLVWMDEAWDCVTAWHFINTGVWGNPFFGALWNYGTHDYTGMPMLLVLETFMFRLFGLGLTQARMVTVLCGLATVLFTYLLGKKVFGQNVGLAAAAILSANTIFFVMSRTVRYEICVAMFTVIALYVYVHAAEKQKPWLYGLTGLLAGMAFLSHITYGIFCPVALAALIAYDCVTGRAKFKNVVPFGLGAFAVLLPYLLWIAYDFPSFVAQSHSISERLGFSDWRFYVQNIAAEKVRWLAIPLVIFPAFVGLIYSLKHFFRERALVWTLLIFLFGLAVLNYNKFQGYTTVTMPLFSIFIGLFILDTIGYVRKKDNPGPVKIIVSVVMLITVIFILAQAVGNLNAINECRDSDYYAFTSEIDSMIPPGSVVMGQPTFWLGLSDHGYLATHYFKYLKAWRTPELTDALGQNFSEAVRTTNVSVIILDGMLKYQMYNESSIPADEVDDFLARNATLLGTVEDRFYGDESGVYGNEVKVYRVNG